MKALLFILCRVFAANSSRSARFPAVLSALMGLAASDANGADLTFTFSSATDVAVNAGSYAASGTATLALNFAPATGTSLTVINHTGLGFISGAFSNLAQGQEVVLDYEGQPYLFVASYYGGTGNDLVLQWANLRVLAWGSNSNHQLGNNSSINSPVPVPVAQSEVLTRRRIVALAGGYVHSLGLCSDGTLAAWGANLQGQLGNQKTGASSEPFPVFQNGVLASKTVIAISAGSNHSLALCSDGTLAAWGYNASGQLGNNSTSDSNVPVAVLQNGVLTGKTVVAISAGGRHNLALCSDGTMAAWGENGNGQLGNNSKTNSSVPVVVSQTGVLLGKTVVAVSAGGDHNLVLCSDGTLAAWGSNYWGQLGNGVISGTPSLLPVAVRRNGVLAGKTITAVSAGGDHCLVLCSDGTLAAWGHNSDGQVGNNSTVNQSAPVAVLQSGILAGKKAVAISTGLTHSLALCSDGTLASWGNNDNGELGNGSTVTSFVPVAVTTTALAAGERFLLGKNGPMAFHTLVLVASPPPPPPLPAATTRVATNISAAGATLNGTVNANYNSTAVTFEYGTTKAYGTTVSGTPTPLVGSSAQAVDATVTGLDPGTPYYFRVNGTSKSGTGNGGDHAFITPGTITLLSATDVPATAGGFSASGELDIVLDFKPPVGANLTVVNNTGLDLIRGTFTNLAQGQPVTLSFNGLPYRFVVNYFGGTGNDLVLQWANVRPVAWGDNEDGQLGYGNRPGSSAPVAVLQSGVLAGKTVVAMAAGSEHSLALCSDGTLAAWGNNNYGQLGNASKTPSRVPVAVRQSGFLSGKTVIAVSAGASHNLVLCSDGTLAAWGYNGSGQLGNKSTVSSLVPVAVLQTGALAGKTVTKVSAGSFHSLVLCSDGTAVAWGDNYWGQLGNNTRPNSSVPVEVLQSGVLFGKSIMSVAAGGQYCLALCSDSTLVTWGNNWYGQLGNNSTTTNSIVPVTVQQSGILAGKTVAAVSAGDGQNFALCLDGELAAWGSNGYGQLGNNRTVNSPVPVSVLQSGVLAGKTISAVSSGMWHSLALCMDGTVAAWGYNFLGQLGNQSNVYNSPVPVAVVSTGLASGERFVSVESGPQASHTLALVASPDPVPASITVSSGSGQRAEANTAFGAPLVALVQDSGNKPIGGISVTFTAPDSGASAAFGSNTSVTVLTDLSGLASSGTLTATTANGSYIVSATTPAVAASARFSLGNGTVNPTPTMPATPPGGFQVTRQTGLYEVIIPVQNTTPLPINGFRLHVDLSAYLAAYPSLRLYNAASSGGSTGYYIDYPYPLAVDQVVSMKLSFYTKTRTFPNPFAPGLTVEILTASQVSGTLGNGVQPSLISMQNGSVLLEFPTVPGRWYRVRYCSDMVHWLDCPRPLQATGPVMQWSDCGPPFTNVPPTEAPSRLYTVNEINTP